MAITERQYDYIKILSDYDSTRVEDLKDIQNFLQSRSKTDLKQLSKREASDLIQLLLERPVNYTLPCGRQVYLSKQDVNSFHFLGEIEACLHHCPDPIIKGNVNGCDAFKKYQEINWDDE